MDLGAFEEAGRRFQLQCFLEDRVMRLRTEKTAQKPGENLHGFWAPFGGPVESHDET